MGIEHALYGHYFSSILKLVGVQQAAIAVSRLVLTLQ